MIALGFGSADTRSKFGHEILSKKQARGEPESGEFYHTARAWLIVTAAARASD